MNGAVGIAAAVLAAGWTNQNVTDCLAKMDASNTKLDALLAATSDLNEWCALLILAYCASCGWYLVGRLGRGSALWGVRGERA